MDPLLIWHEFVKTGDMGILDQLLANEVSFHSPVVWLPQKGKQLTKMYLTAAMHILRQGGFHYSKEIVSGQQACLEFETQIGEITVNGVDIITWNDAGKITEFKVMIRPVKALNIVWKKMAEMLGKMQE